VKQKDESVDDLSVCHLELVCTLVIMHQMIKFEQSFSYVMQQYSDISFKTKSKSDTL
jgi:hypothetical protein